MIIVHQSARYRGGWQAIAGAAYVLSESFIAATFIPPIVTRRRNFCERMEMVERA